MGLFYNLCIFICATQATIVQNNTKSSKESYFKKIQAGRYIVGMAGEQVKARSNMECSYGYLQI